MTLLGCLFSLGSGFKPSSCCAHFPYTLPVQLLNAPRQTFSSYCVGILSFPPELRETSSRHAFSSTILIVSLWGKRKRLGGLLTQPRTHLCICQRGDIMMRACLCIQEDKEGEKEGERECSMLTFIVYHPPQLMSK